MTVRRTTGVVALVMILAAGGAVAQTACVNDAPNPYRAAGSFGQLPDGRIWGATSAIFTSSDGNIWVADRCIAPNCADSNLAPIFELDQTGKVLKNFGAGLFVYPHGISVDREGNVWVADAQAKGAKGQQVTKLDRNGKVLMTLGKPGQIGTGLDTFDQPDMAIVDRNGDIVVLEGHPPTYGNSRIVKFTKDGQFIKTWGSKGTGPGQYMGPHAVAFDSQGRLFIADRANNRLVVTDGEGNFIAEWRQFGRPSGVFIDANDMIYVADSQSNADPANPNFNAACRMGIRVGNAKTGQVTAFIPAPDDGIVPPEGIAVDTNGNIYGARVDGKDVIKYVRN